MASGSETLLKRRRIDGASPASLLLAWPDAVELTLSPDGNWIVFHGASGLYSLPVDGRQGVRRLDFDSTSFARVQFTPDSNFVLFPANGGLQNGLFRARVDGSQPPVRLGGHPQGAVGDFSVTPDGDEVLFTADADLDAAGGMELYRAPSDGSAAPVLLGGTRVELFEHDLRSGRVVYNENLSLRSVPLQGGPSAELGVIGGAIDHSSYWVLGEGHVAFFSSFPNCGGHGSVARLFSVPIAGGEGTLLDSVCTGAVATPLARDALGASLLFVAFSETRLRLHRTRIDGSSQAREIPGPTWITPFGSLFEPTPDGEYLLCQSQQVGIATELFALRLRPRARLR